MSSPETTEADAPVAEVDEAREAVLALLTEELGDAVVGSLIKPGQDLWVRVTREAWYEAGMVVRDRGNFKAFGFLSAIDWLPSPFGKNEDSPTDGLPDLSAAPGEIVTGYTGGDTRFQVFARVGSLTRKIGITLKVDVPDDDLTVPTWLKVYAGVNWHERELAEMFGIQAVGHPHLANLYLPGDFEGHPLRKTFPLLARHVKPWPGIVDVEPMPAGDDETEAAEGAEGAES